MTDTEAASESTWLTTVLDQYEGPLVRYAARLTGDLESARDVVQETFLRLCSEDRGKLNGHEVEWLFTVCRHQAMDVRRKESRMIPNSDVQEQACTSPDPSPAAQLEAKESTGRVQHVLATLSQNQQEVIRLRFQNGLSYHQISQVTKLSVTNVGYLIHTAIKTIRERLNIQPASAPSAGRNN